MGFDPDEMGSFVLEKKFQRENMIVFLHLFYVAFLFYVLFFFCVLLAHRPNEQLVIFMLLEGVYNRVV